MCGRYYIEQEDIELQEILAALGHDERIKTGEVFPTNIVPVLTADKKPQLMRWGFTRYDGKGTIINARSETVTEKPMFQKAMRERRCLLPASWYFEWKALGANKKQKHAISLPGQNILYMAGIYREEKDMDLPVFVILTRQDAPSISDIHSRMPVILPKAIKPLWLHAFDPEKLLDMAEQNVKAHSV
ncbi:MAG: SOS response-associated peptidase [Candidatus Pelethousia sp.]|nr:SOS response-associated peptidase [Candidatus Pelethousia sp.]